MGSTRSKGKLKKWFDAKGFGFIAPEKGSKDIFIHISAFDKYIPRKPEIGDTIFYHTTTDNKGKIKIVDAVIEGAAPITPRKKPVQDKRTYRERRSNWKLLVLTTVLLAGGGSTLFNRFQSTGHILPSSGFSSGTSSAQQFTCSGKTHCSEMTSCAEAKYYLRNCPDTKMDGDGDGIPCERQWCN